jgi:hypothetical protein
MGAFLPTRAHPAGCQKPINDDGITLDRFSSTRPRSSAIDHSRSTVYCDTLRIRKDNFTAIGNFLWIDDSFHRPQLLLEHLLQVADFTLHLPACFFCRPAIAQVRVPCCLARLFFHFAFRFPEAALDFILCARFHKNKIARCERGGCSMI